ncbi:cellulose binding domain-containing protein [Thalassomonas viridans]|uniref:Cellulose binding domain-containing protein n=1 Tax=Thalassomonas viridans TaxID=137584 RepID=A0AAE9Z9M6_9GAMM|nr:cellulose binding domain-containing protein [Thalassomonas viridans]WDE08664.1 cellulose binding domain-containing protein [Thalassomonas viridans]
MMMNNITKLSFVMIMAFVSCEVLAAKECEVHMQVQSQWNGGYMAAVVVRNTGDEVIDNWSLDWVWPSDQQITYSWNAAVNQQANNVYAEGTGNFTAIPVGQAQSFGFNIDFSGGEMTPEFINASCSSASSGTDPVLPPTEPSDSTIVASLDNFNMMLGTQTINPGYSFTDDGSLVETAKAIRAMGSNLLKIALSTSQYPELNGQGLEYQFKRIVAEIPEFRQVLAMDFSYYMLWVEDSGSWMDNQGMSEDELTWQYDKIYDLTKYLLTQYNGTGKTFMLGNWEGDWNFIQDADGVRDVNNSVANPQRIQGLIDWLNIRQKAVDDAKASVAHNNVNVLHYVEVNRVADAIAGKARITNTVLPYVNVDLVSYSAYDVTTEERHADFNTMRTELTGALDFIESKLPDKEGIPFNKRVFIGEYGFAESWFSDWGERSGEVQDDLSRNVVKAALDWGTPFVLNWQMYGNEYDSYMGDYKGYWLIDNKNTKKPIYYTFSEFYAQAQAYLVEYQNAYNRLPSEEEYRVKALSLLEADTETAPLPVEPPPSVQGSCEAVYSVQSDWGNGMMANVAIRNTGDTAVSDWQVQWTWPENHQIVNQWNEAVEQSGQLVSVDSQTVIPAGETRAFGFIANYSGDNFFPEVQVSCTSGKEGGNSPDDDAGHSVKLWFVGDSITYGMASLPHSSQGFRSQIWQNMLDAGNGASNFPLTVTDNAEIVQFSYAGNPLTSVGTVSGPSGEGDLSLRSGNYWHSGIPGATISDQLCFLDPKGHSVANGYNFDSCSAAIANFNGLLAPSCRESADSNGWLENPNCTLMQSISPDDALVIPLQLGTNDITFLSSSGAIDCRYQPTDASQTAQRLDQVVSSLLSAEDFADDSTLLGKIYNRLKAMGVAHERIAFVVSMIPKRTSLDGQDPDNHCTDYYNARLNAHVQALASSLNIVWADQGNIVPMGDSVHPSTAEHKVMACNLLYGYNLAFAEDFICPVPAGMPDNGLLNAIERVSN